MNVLTLLLVAQFALPAAVAAARPAERPALLHRIYVPDDDFAALMAGTRGQELRALPLAEVRRMVAEDLKVRLEEARRAAADAERSAVEPWLVLGATLDGRIEEDFLRVTATWRVKLQKPGWHSLPLSNERATVARATVDGAPAMLRLEGEEGPLAAQRAQQAFAAQDAGGGLFALLLEPDGAGGTVRTVSLEFVVPVRTVGYYREASFALLPAPATELQVTLPGSNLDVTVEPGLGVALAPAGADTRVSCRLRPAAQVSLQWFRLARARESAAETPAATGAPEVEAKPQTPQCPDPAWVQAEVFHDVALGEGRVEGTATVRLTVHRRPVAGLAISFPAGLDLVELEPQEDLVRRWQVDGATRTLQVEFRRNVEDEATVAVHYAADTRGKSTFRATVPALAVAGVQREFGWVAVRRRTNVSLAEAQREGLEEVPLSQVPQGFLTGDVAKALLIYRYLRHPFALVLDVTRHPDASVLTTVVDRLEAGTLVAADGAAMTRLTLDLRTMTREPLELDLGPCGEGATVAEALLAGRPATLSQSPAGGLLVPLADLPEAPDQSHRLELTLLHRTARLRSSGTLALRLPALGVPVKEAFWSWWVPDTRTCFSFGGNLRPDVRTVPGAPVDLANGGYAPYGLGRALVPPGVALAADCAYVRRWLADLPWYLFFLVGLAGLHGCLVVLLGGRFQSQALSALVAGTVVLVLFEEQLDGYFEALASGASAYLVLLGAWLALLLAGRLRTWRRTGPPGRPMSPVETNVARVVPDVEGSGARG